MGDFLSKKSWTVYIIQTDNGKLYTGITTDLKRRFLEHKESKRGAKFFKISGPKKIVYKECQPSRSKASKREAEIKKMKREQKLRLIK